LHIIFHALSVRIEVYEGLRHVLRCRRQQEKTNKWVFEKAE